MNPNANPNDPLGVDLAQINLGAPPRPPLVGASPHPSAPGPSGAKVGFACFLFLRSPFYLSFADVLLLF